MLKYLTSSKYRVKREELNDIQMLNEKFQNFQEQKIRAYIKILSQMELKDEFEDIISIFHEQYGKKCPYQLLKIACFFHVIIQQIPDFAQSLLTSEINTLQKSIESNARSIKQKGRSKSANKRRGNQSIEKTIKWLKEKINTPKQQRGKVKKTFSFHEESEKEQIYSKQEFVIEKIVKPYLLYLMKSLSLISLYNKCRLKQKLQFHEAWILLNILKYLLQVSLCFNQSGRYYKNEFLPMVLCLAQILGSEVNFIYPCLKKIIQQEALNISEYYMKKKNQSIKSQIEIIEQLMVKYRMGDVIDILEQVGKINQSMQQLFYCKYYYQKLQCLKNQPRFLITTSEKFDILFQLKNIYKRKKSEKIFEKNEQQVSQLTLRLSTRSSPRKNEQTKNFRMLRISNNIRNRDQINN